MQQHLKESSFFYSGHTNLYTLVLLSLWQALCVRLGLLGTSHPTHPIYTYGLSQAKRYQQINTSSTNEVKKKADYVKGVKQAAEHNITCEFSTIENSRRLKFIIWIYKCQF